MYRFGAPIECFHSRGQHLCKFIGTKESVCIKKEFNFGTLTSAAVTSCENSPEIWSSLFLSFRSRTSIRAHKKKILRRRAEIQNFSNT